MTTNGNTDETTLPPNEAYAVLGNETRMQILQTLGEADGPLTFSALRERVGMGDSGQFNYHLGKLTGHFLQETDDGYELRRAGARVIESILSGAVTQTSALEPTVIDEPCHLCGGPLEVSFQQERLEMYCTECAGLFGETNRTGEWLSESSHGYLGYLPLPPAGMRGRTPNEVYRAAWVWGNLEILSLASGVCPRCSATVDYSIDVCEEHDTSDGLCDRCDRRKALNLHFTCANCIFEGGGAFVVGLVAKTELLAFLIESELNPINPDSPSEVDRVHTDFDEEVLSLDPFKARFTFEFDGSSISLIVDGDLTVVDTSEGPPTQ